MNRIWAGLPIAMMVAVPLWTETSAPVVVIEALAALFCVCGILWYSLALVTTGAVFGTIGYAVAVWSANHGADVIGGAVYGLAMLFLLDLSEFGRRFHGAAIASSVIRAQTAYWFGRAVLIVGAIVLLVLAGSVLAALVPGAGRAVIAGLGVVIALAGALYAGTSRTEA